jgi:hypothetical protein
VLVNGNAVLTVVNKGLQEVSRPLQSGDELLLQA